MAICKSRANLFKFTENALQCVALAGGNNMVGFEKNKGTSCKLGIKLLINTW